MADDYRGRGLQPREYSGESQYPPPPGSEDDRSRMDVLPPPNHPMSGGSSVTLPSIHDPYGGGHGGHGASHGASRYPPLDDGRSRGDYSASPTNSNGYGAPSSGAGYSLPPVQAPPHDPRAPYANDRRGPYQPAQRQSYSSPDPYHPYNGYRAAPQPQQHHYPGYADYQGQAPPQQAPRQRTSIACRYCRKRKIRCSGYQSTPDGKCTNCKKTGNDCVFQPVSSATSTAFVPVSAIQGGVPPGTPLYGAFGQPLAPAGAAGAGAAPPPSYATPSSAGSDYPLPSPTGSAGYYGPPDDRAGPHGTRRPRPVDDEHGMRLPPPHPYPQEEDPRRRSPASMHSNTPPGGYSQYPQRGPEHEGDAGPRRNSPGGGASAISIVNLVDAPAGRGRQAESIDQSMLGRLNRTS